MHILPFPWDYESGVYFWHKTFAYLFSVFEKVSITLQKSDNVISINHLKKTAKR